MNENKILVIDIETTGLRPQNSIITEVGIVELDLTNGKRKILFDKTCHNKTPFLNLEHVQNSWIVKQGYMTVEEIKTSIDFRLIQDEIQEIVNAYPLGATAFNRVFDISFLSYYGIKFPVELQCPMILSTPIVKAPHKNPTHKGFKWPKVEEAYDHFFPNNTYEEIHRGADDAFHEAQIVYELFKLKVFTV